MRVAVSGAVTLAPPLREVRLNMEQERRQSGHASRLG